MSRAHGPKVVTNGLIWSIDAANPKCYSGDSDVVDMVRGITGKVEGSISVSNGAFDFNGTNSRIDMLTPYVDSDSKFTHESAVDNYTLEAWIYVRSSQGTTTNGDSIFGTSGSTGYGMQVGINGSVPRINFMARSTGNWYGADFNYNEWIHLVYVREESVRVQEWQNGVLTATSGATTSFGIVTTNLGKLTVGNSSPRVSGYFDGLMGTLRMYNRALTESEIKQNYNAQRRRYGV